MTSVREWINHWFYGGEQSRSRNMRRQGITFYSRNHCLDTNRLTTISTRPPFNDPNWKWGIDIAGIWDGILDAEKFAQSGGSFVIVKAADGTITGKYLYENTARVKACPGLGYAHYDWLYPGNCVSLKAQGQKWAALANETHPAAVFLDYEWTSFLGRPANPDESDLLEAAAWLAQTWSGPIGMYSAPGYLMDHPLSERSRFLLWYIAQYGVLYPAPVYPFGTNYTVWQQSDRWAPAADWGIDPDFAHATDGDVMAPAAYTSLFTGVQPPPPEPPTDHVTQPYPGVQVTLGRRFDSTFQMIAVAPSAILNEHITAPGMAHIVENIPGDIVVNGGDFNMTTYQAIGLLRSEGRLYAPQADSEPAIAFDGRGGAWLDHHVQPAWTDALGLKRYIVQNGAQAPNTSAAWANLEPRTIYGLRSDGTRLLLQVKGRQANEAGVTLYQAAAVMVEFGANVAGDGDGGDSVQGKVAGSVFVGTLQRRLVADFYTITIIPGDDPMAQYNCRVLLFTKIRRSPSITGVEVGTGLNAGQTFQAIDLRIVRTDWEEWLRLPDDAGGERWTAAWYPNSLQTAGKHFVEYSPVVTPPPPPPTDDTITVTDTLELVNNATGERYRGTVTGTLTRVV